MVTVKATSGTVVARSEDEAPRILQESDVVFPNETVDTRAGSAVLVLPDGRELIVAQGQQTLIAGEISEDAGAPGSTDTGPSADDSLELGEFDPNELEPTAAGPGGPVDDGGSRQPVLIARNELRGGLVSNDGIDTDSLGDPRSLKLPEEDDLNTALDGVSSAASLQLQGNIFRLLGVPFDESAESPTTTVQALSIKGEPIGLSEGVYDLRGYAGGDETRPPAWSLTIEPDGDYLVTWNAALLAVGAGRDAAFADFWLEVSYLSEGEEGDGVIRVDFEPAGITLRADRPPEPDTAVVETDEDVTAQGILLAENSDGDTLTFAAGPITPAHGKLALLADGTFSYEPAANFFGTDQFSYIVSDGYFSVEKTVQVIVNSVNDVPVPETAALATTEDTVLVGALKATDIESGNLAFALLAPASHGLVIIDEDGRYRYEPEADFFGEDSFSYTVSDGTDTVEQVVTVTVAAVNDAPVAETTALAGSEDTVLSGALSARDVDGDPLTFAAGSTLPSNGTLNIASDGSYTYTPNANFSGTDTFSYTVSDRTETVEQTVTSNGAGGHRQRP